MRILSMSNNSNNSNKSEEIDINNEEYVEEESKSKIFSEIKTSVKDIIDELKKTENTTISSIIEKSVLHYTEFKNLDPQIKALLDQYIEIYGDLNSVLEEALTLLDAQKNPDAEDNLSLWCRARDEMQMMLIGKTTFNQLLAAAETPKESLDKPIKKNIALDIILWYTRKPIKSLSLDEIINTIKKVWIMANYFYFIDIRQEDNNSYHIIMKHHQNRRYSNFWLQYFIEVFSSSDLSFKCEVTGEALDETVSMSIKKN